MSSYQNISEADIQGYNDCSLLMSYTKPSLTKSSKSSRSTRKLSHHNLLNSATSLASLNISGASSKLDTPPIMSSMMPPPPSPPSTTTSTKSIDPALSSVNDTLPLKSINSGSSEITEDQLLSQLDDLKTQRTKLNEREFQHYISKIRTYIQSNAGKLNRETKSVMAKYLQSHDQGKDAKELMVYVMNNDGSSVWGLPLKKILENAQPN
ncbi:hypothetical protein WICPIJ_002809 [Wickerhamomyces pijperi]|uniref:Uncharacterized protein n=1 Tax=Wickerhamomyces pijperi TaxID=599730 RepID=A0A9P8TPH2_WICPI|nr:hypothetical protein WICPIJ_002809 [Wickerhamomyces pijperi]